MSIRIEVEKVKSINGRKYEIKAIQALTFGELPTEYTNGGYPFVYLYDDDRTVLNMKYTKSGSVVPIIHNLGTGDIVSPERLEEILTICHKSGERLKGINDKIRKELDGWEGRQVFII